MGVRNPNSTNYVHTDESNLLNIHKAMDYTGDGKPALRVLSNIQGDITIEGAVTIPGEVTVTTDADNPLYTHTHIYTPNDLEVSDTNPFAVNVFNLPATQTVDGTVNIGTMPNVTINQPVAITDNNSSITVDGTVNATVSGTVAVSNFPATQPVSGTVIIQDGGGSITVDGTVSVTGAGAFPSEVIGTDPYGNSVLRINDTTTQHTAKNRVKVSTYEITDFTTFTTGINPDQWDQVITGTASATFDQYLGMARLQVGSAVGDSIIRQTTRVQRYIPGRQSEVSMTVIFGTPTTGIRKRLGLFDELNGFYFEDSGNGSYSCVLRRNSADGVVDEERFARADWNVDPLDGTGASGITADPMAIQHMCMEYEWYGAGMIEWNFIINNNKYPIHRIFHANVHDHTWAASAALPVRIEFTNFGGAAGTHTFHQGSHSVSVDGTTTLLGRQKSISSAITGKNLNAANTFTPVVAIRLKSTALDGVVVPDEYSAATLDNTNIFVQVIENAVVTGGTWVSFSPESSVEYNITATGFSGGTALSRIYVSAGNMGELYSFPERSVTQINRTTTTNLADTSGNFLIAVAATASNKSGWASLGWIEVR